MAGGQVATFGQGSTAGSIDLPLTGVASSTGIGTLIGGPGYVLTGSEQTAAAGTTFSTMFVPLKSRKVGAGSVTFALTGIPLTVATGNVVFVQGYPIVGSQAAAAAGTLGRARSIALTGRSITASQGTMAASGQTVAWTSFASVLFTQNSTPQTYDLTQNTVGFNPSIHQMAMNPTSPALPSGVTLNSTGSLLYNGTGAATSVSNVKIDINTIAAAGDWATRSTAAGVLQALSLGTQADLDAVYFHDLFVARDPAVTLDTTIKPTGQAGSAKFLILNTDSASVGACAIRFPRVFWTGDTFWVSYRVYAPPSHVYQQFPNTNNGGGNKLSITSQSPDIPSGQSNTPWEIVIQTQYREQNCLSGYHQNGIVTDVDENVAFGGSDYREQPSIDRAVYCPSYLNYPLINPNPDTGQPWSAAEQTRRQYGTTYHGTQTSDFREGFGDPLTGAVRHWPNEWMTITQRIIVGTPGTVSTQRTIWIARQGQPYEKIVDLTIQIGGSSGPQPQYSYSAHWLLPYFTSRTPNAGRSIQSHTSNIGGITVWSCGPSTPVGNATLSYNSSTQRFTFAGFGESVGQTRGFSVVNHKMIFSVESGGAHDSYVVLEVTNTALLPTNGTVTDTYTIIDGRPDTQMNYAEYILSTQPINAEGGFAPT